MRLSKITYIVLAVILFVTSCDIIKPLDDLEPKYQLVEENTYVDAIKVEAALDGMYAGWRATGTYGLPRNLMTLSGNYTSRYDDYVNNSVEIDNVENKTAYVSFYKTIQRSNFLIENLQADKEIYALSKERRLEIEGEARLSRAMCHFRLLECYGQFYDVNSEYGIVLKMKASRTVEAIPRNSVKQSYDAILEDLDFAIKNAPEVSEHYKFSQTLAKANKAKVLLYMGEYADAATLALEVMGDMNYDLEDTYADIFAKGYNSREVLFSPHMMSKFEKVNIYLKSYDDVLNIETIADNEVDDGIDGEGAIVKNYDARYEFTHIDGLVNGVTNQKYPFETSGEGEQENSIINMRMAEVYLIYAEAMARSESGVSSEAVAKLNRIRERAGMPQKSPASKADLLETIRIEKNLELHVEMAQPWFDMIRYHILGDIEISDIKPTITSNDQLILPIPLSALEGNGKLRQNPGYATGL